METQLDLRKTLVIGLGTTGKKVAEYVAEHLNWQFGSFEKANWVRLLVLETDKSSSPLGDRVLHGGMSGDDFNQYVMQPKTAGADFDFYDWQDSALFDGIPDPASGAGNVRMVGRLCLFHPPTYQKLRMRVEREMEHLLGLTPQKVAEGLEQPGLSVHFQQDTVVYVVGTLCGGTCSGGGADLGYMLRVWNKEVKRQAVFTLPHPDLSGALAPRFKKNAYYALTELNHYQLKENAWDQKLSGNADKHNMSNVTPYDILRVVMPKGPSGKAAEDLNAMIGQYIAATAGFAGGRIAAKEVDAFSQLAKTQNIGNMRPLFSTMGIGALEYPGELVQRAATTRLIGSMLQRWSQPLRDPELIKAAIERLGGGDFDLHLRRLTEQNGEKLSVVLIREISKPMKDGGTPRVEEVRHLLHEMGSRIQSTLLTDDGSATDGLPTLLTVMQKNHDQFLQNIRSEVEKMVDQHLFRLEGGPGTVIAILEHLLTQLEKWGDAARQGSEDSEQDAASLRRILDEQIDAVEKLQNSRNPLGKREKLRDGWEKVTTGIQSYIETEINTQAFSHLKRREMIQQMQDQYRQTTVTLIRRLRAMQEAFQQEAGELNRQWSDAAKQTPSVNGRAYFDAEPPAKRGTVTDVYYNLLTQRNWPGEPPGGWDETRKEEAAQRSLLTSLETLRSELFRSDSSGAFDPRPEIKTAQDRVTPQMRDALETNAREFFEKLRDQKHIADMTNDADVATAIQVSEPGLGVSGTQVSEQLAGTAGAAPLAQNFALLDMGADGAGTRSSLEPVKRAIEHNLILASGGVTNSRDPFRLLIIREKHGFTFGQMAGVARANEHDLTALQSAEHCQDFNQWHTRRDINWVNPLASPQALETIEENLLLVLLLGRPKDDILEWTPADKGEIAPKGWYQVAGGAFSLYYPEGVVDARAASMEVSSSFRLAVNQLMSAEAASMRRSIKNHFSRYKAEQNGDHVVQVIDKALDSLGVLNIHDMDRKQAESIIRRHYRRDENLSKAFFELKTKDMKKGHAEFAHLWHQADEEIPEKDSVYGADAYFCDKGHPLGKTVESLLKLNFQCPVCNTGERFWP